MGLDELVRVVIDLAAMAVEPNDDRQVLKRRCRTLLENPDAVRELMERLEIEIDN